MISPTSRRSRGGEAGESTEYDGLYRWIGLSERRIGADHCLIPFTPERRLERPVEDLVSDRGELFRDRDDRFGLVGYALLDEPFLYRPGRL